ncbi:MAG: hypothetical protein GY756_27610, partial [bacterium]|nr:hypothetical protein [bacterium]
MKKIILFASIILFTITGLATTYTATGDYSFSSDTDILSIQYNYSSFTSPSAGDTVEYSNVSITQTQLSLELDSVTTLYERDSGVIDDITGVWYNDDSKKYIVLAKEISINSGKVILSTDDTVVTTTTDDEDATIT